MEQACRDLASGRKHKLLRQTAWTLDLGRPFKAKSKAAGRELPSMVSGNTWKSKDGFMASIVVYSSVSSPSLSQHGAGWQRVVPTTEGKQDDSSRAHVCDHRSVRGTSASRAPLHCIPAFHLRSSDPEHAYPL